MTKLKGNDDNEGEQRNVMGSKKMLPLAVHICLAASKWMGLTTGATTPAARKIMILPGVECAWLTIVYDCTLFLCYLNGSHLVQV